MIKYFFFLLVFGVTLFGCKEKVEKAKPKIFRYNEKAGIATLDPLMANDMQHNWVFHMLYNGLVDLNENLEIVPSIAKSWEISPDGLTYRFFLRDDVYFHPYPKGTQVKRLVKSSDFVSTFYRIIESKRGLQSFVDRLDIEHLDESIYAEDDFTFVIHLQEAFPPLLGVLSMQMYSVLPIDVVEGLGASFRAKPIGTGPFMLKRWDEGNRLVLEKNPFYFETADNGDTLPYLDGVEVSFIKDPYAEFMNFSTGKLDMISALEGAVKDKLVDAEGVMKEEFNDRYVFESKPFLNTEYLGFILNEDPMNVFNNVFVRKAINYGLDKKKMIRFLKNNMGIAANQGFVPLGFPGYDATRIDGYSYNTNKAREMLIKAGYPNGEGLPEITLYTTATYQELCEYIQYQLKQININVKVEINNSVLHRENVCNGTFTFFRKSWIADYPDPENYLSLFYGRNSWPNGANYTRYNNQKFNMLYDQSIKELNDEKRNELYVQMDQMVMNDAPVVPLYYDKSYRIYHKEITGFKNNPINLLDLTHVNK